MCMFEEIKLNHVILCFSRGIFARVNACPRGECRGLFTLCADREASGSRLIAVEWRGVMYGYGQLH